MTDPATAISDAYHLAEHRLLLLDYDGTLTPLAPTPPQARPTPELLGLLERLAGDSRNTVVIISGRDRQTLEAWLGQLPVSFVAEHGAFYRPVGQQWRTWAPDATTWKARGKKLMTATARQLPDSFVEEKATALVWHYRQADSKAVETHLQPLSQALQPLAAQYDLKVSHGAKMLELSPASVDKGAAAKRLLAEASWDFILAAGDDTTDEDLFMGLPRTAHTIKVGPDPTAARYQVARPADFIRLLNSLIA